MANEKWLIDANALQKEFTTIADKSNLDYIFIDVISDAIEDAPTVDAVEVVHGRWIWGESNHREWMKCSECLKSQTPNLCFTYCPNCGAKMDGGNEDG